MSVKAGEPGAVDPLGPLKAWILSKSSAAGAEDACPQQLLAVDFDTFELVSWLLDVLVQQCTQEPHHQCMLSGLSSTRDATKESAYQRLQHLEAVMDAEVLEALAVQGSCRRILHLLPIFVPMNRGKEWALCANLRRKFQQVIGTAPHKWVLASLGTMYPQLMVFLLLKDLQLASLHSETLSYLCAKAPHAVQMAVACFLERDGAVVRKLKFLMACFTQTVGLSSICLPVLLSDVMRMDPAVLIAAVEGEDADDWQQVIKDLVDYRLEEMGQSAVQLLDLAYQCASVLPQDSHAAHRLLVLFLDALNSALQARVPDLVAQGGTGRGPSPAPEAEAVSFARAVSADLDRFMRQSIHLLQTQATEAVTNIALLLREVVIVSGLVDPQSAARHLVGCYHSLLQDRGTDAPVPSIIDCFVYVCASYRFHVPQFLPNFLLPALCELQPDTALACMLMAMQKISPHHTPSFLQLEQHIEPASVMFSAAERFLRDAPVTPHARVRLLFEEAYVLNGVLHSTWQRVQRHNAKQFEPVDLDLLEVWRWCLVRLKDFLIADHIEHAAFGPRKHPLSRTNIPGGLDDSLSFDTIYLAGLACFLLQSRLHFVVGDQIARRCQTQSHRLDYRDVLGRLDSALYMIMNILVTTDDCEEGGGNVYLLLHHCTQFLFVANSSSTHAEPIVPGNCVLPPFAFCASHPLPMPIPNAAAFHTAVFRTIVALCHSTAQMQTCIPGRAIHMLTNMLLEWTSSPIMGQHPLSRYSEILPRKVAFDRDIFVAQLFKNYSVLWSILELIAEDPACFAELPDLLRCLLAYLIGFWNGCTQSNPIDDAGDPTVDVQLRHSMSLLKAMAQAGYIPPPLSYAHILLPYLSSLERRNILHEIWTFLADFAPRRPSEVMQAEMGREHMLYPIGMFHADRNFGLLFHRQRQRRRALNAMAQDTGGYEDAEYWSETDYSEPESDAEGSGSDMDSPFGDSDAFVSDEEMEDVYGEEGAVDDLEAEDDAFTTDDDVIITDAKEYPMVTDDDMEKGDKEEEEEEDDDDDDEEEEELGARPSLEGDRSATVGERSDCDDGDQGHVSDVPDSSSDEAQEEDQEDEDELQALTAMLCGPQHKGQPLEATLPSQRFNPPVIDASILKHYTGHTLRILKAHPELTPYMSLFYPFAD